MNKSLDTIVQKIKESRVSPASFAVLPDGSPAEMVYDPATGHTRFAVWRDGTVGYEERLVVSETRTLRPYAPDNSLIRNEIVLFPSAAEPYESEALAAKAQAFIYRYVEATFTSSPDVHGDPEWL